VSDDSLAGCGVVVTRPAGQAGELIRAIDKAAGHTIAFPVIDIVGRENAAVVADFARLPKPDLVIFISRNAVQFGHAILSGLTTRVAAVGPATATALATVGVEVDIVPVDGFDSEHLLSHPSMQNVEGMSVTIVRAEDGRELLADSLRSRGADVSYLTAYQRLAHVPDEHELRNLENAWQNGGVQCVMVMSIDSLQNFLQLVPASCHELLRKTLLVAPGNRVIQTAKKLIPGARAAQSPGPQATDMVNTLIALWQSGKNR